MRFQSSLKGSPSVAVIFRSSRSRRGLAVLLTTCAVAFVPGSRMAFADQRDREDDQERGRQNIFETNITHTYSAALGRMAGEPGVTVNPKDTQNLIMAGTAHKKHATLPFGDSVAICPLGVSFDGGRTWSLQEIPLGRVAGTSEDVCADGFTGADRHGTLYAGGIIFPHIAVTGHVRLVR